MNPKILLKSFTFIFLLMAADIALISCYKSKTYKYKYSDTHLEVMDAGTYERYVADDKDSVPFNNLFMDVHISSQIIAKANIPQSMFVGSAMGFQPNEDYYINTSRIKNIKVTSLLDYNSSFPAGSDITANCYFSVSASHTSNDTFAITQFIEKYNSHIAANEKMLEPHIPSTMFWFRFKQPPQNKSTQKFSIAIEMEDGSTLQANSFSFRIY